MSLWMMIGAAHAVQHNFIFKASNHNATPSENQCEFTPCVLMHLDCSKVNILEEGVLRARD